MFATLTTASFCNEFIRFHYTPATFGYIPEPAAAELCFNKKQRNMDLKNSTILITVGTSGIGLELVKQLAE
ncbi:hypothetical protein BC343_14020 [Mucilaginibacter pedocola]|uniref:Uncharacterized protein n=2 Tax=Mucilaginibacter pedocola TaxID=1792845 RepID=A0A1S9PAN8_9SPHI|nr:hypothetical protein BC343_14020 [Mucilaginibacter pedocola]